MTTIVCPNCFESYEVQPEVIGRSVKCSGCLHRFTAAAVQEQQEEFATIEPPQEKPAAAIAKRVPFEPPPKPPENEKPAPKRNGYPACRSMQRVFRLFGRLAYIAALLVFIFGGMAVANSGGSIDAAFMLIVAVLSFTFTGYLYHALAELLGGTVSYLTKHECYP